MLATMHVENCQVYHLPGRDWYYLIGPVNSEAKNLAFGVAEFDPAKSAPAHTHDTQEEIIYILEGAGDFVTAEGVKALVPGLAVFIPPGLEHRIIVRGDKPLKLVTLFSPPVIPGAYDAAKK